MINPFPHWATPRLGVVTVSYFSCVDTSVGLEQPAKDIDMDHYPGI